MSKGQHGNKEAKKPKKPPVEVKIIPPAELARGTPKAAQSQQAKK